MWPCHTICILLLETHVKKQQIHLSEYFSNVLSKQMRTKKRMRPLEVYYFLKDVVLGDVSLAQRNSISCKKLVSAAQKIGICSQENYYLCTVSPHLSPRQRQIPKLRDCILQKRVSLYRILKIFKLRDCILNAPLNN